MLLLLATGACGQLGNHKHKVLDQMEYDKISNPKVQAAIIAWQKGDAELWRSHFTNDAQLLDDGHLRNFEKFSTEAIVQERFTSIDKVENDGLDVYGKFHSDTWGDFKTYFKFHQNNEGKFQRLEIGQAHY